MKAFKYLFVFLLCSTYFGAAAQQENVLLSREFWQAEPTLETVKQKIKEGNSPSELTAFGFDAVTSAIFAEADLAIIKYLLSFKDNHVNKLTHDGRTYIFWATYKGNLELASYLLEQGAKTDVVDDKGYTILTFTAVAGQKDPKLYDFIIKNGANVLTEKSKDGANVLLLLIPQLSDFKMIAYFESKGLDLHSKDHYGNGAFNYTASTGNVEMLQKLVAKGLDYKTPNKKGGNAFMFASRGTRGNTNGIAVYNYLESLGINPNVTTTEGENPLHNIAYRVKDPAIFNYFINKGVTVTQKDNNGNTPFMNAAAYNSLEIVSLLNQYIDDINELNTKKQSALTKAISHNTPEVVSFLLDNKANALIVDRQGNNLAYYLIDSYSPNEQDSFKEKIKLLETNHLDFTAKQHKENTLYHIAIEKQDLALLKYLETFNININAINNEGLSVLHIAAMKAQDATILKYLIAHGANKNVLTQFDESVYDLAQENELLQANHININFLK